MSRARFFLDRKLETDARLTLPPGPARHAARVLRLGVGDRLSVFNGAGGEYDAIIESVARDAVAVRVTDFHARERESPLSVLLAQGISSGERMDYTLQKAVELGVAAIQPIAAKRSVVKLSAERADKRLAHWQGVVNSACEQSGRNRVPQVSSPLALADWLGRLPVGRVLLLSPSAPTRLAELAPPDSLQMLVVGPEGGFDAEELAALSAAGAVPIRLGPRVLRTETAALAALAAMLTLWGDF